MDEIKTGCGHGDSRKGGSVSKALKATYFAVLNRGPSVSRTT